MKLPEHIAERIRKWVEDTPTTGMHVDHEAARYGGISLMGTIGATWLMRPDGSIWDVDDDFGRPLVPLADEFHLLALVEGAERHPWLAQLLPSRPAAAVDCRACGGRAKVEIAGSSDGFVYCHVCSGLGWTTTLGAE